VVGCSSFLDSYFERKLIFLVKNGKKYSQEIEMIELTSQKSK